MKMSLWSLKSLEFKIYDFCNLINMIAARIPTAIMFWIWSILGIEMDAGRYTNYSKKPNF